MTSKQQLIGLYIIQIIILILCVTVTRYTGIQYYNKAVEMCDISSYEAYMNSKSFCDFIRPEDVRMP